jgi:hypothetical protein
MAKRKSRNQSVPARLPKYQGENNTKRLVRKGKQ